jgi:hypothetical protein
MVLQDKFETVVKASAAYAADPETMEGIWQGVAGKIYSLSPREQELGLGAKVRQNPNSHSPLCLKVSKVSKAATTHSFIRSEMSQLSIERIILF